ncbi:Uncharacterized protein APZ42_019427 [Daphnia magna]|uniref:Uncharacterized protein n=1 Tax=Daphnia magna TaxID=35525 RepID=A0A164Y5J4_9CRUS|nr:Uncharacterized protein APZ42_019427 [Daphnia magna]
MELTRWKVCRCWFVPWTIGEEPNQRQKHHEPVVNRLLSLHTANAYNCTPIAITELLRLYDNYNLRNYKRTTTTTNVDALARPVINRR